MCAGSSKPVVTSLRAVLATHASTKRPRIAAAILTTVGPGTLLENYDALPYQKRDLNYWPRVEDPFAAAP